MGAVTGLLGIGGGASGTGFAAPGVGANVQSQQQAAQDQLKQQQAFSQALNPYALQAAQSQQALLGQLQQGANGQGPNPALAQLNQTTAANTANQAALMASQRGAGANPALIARQAAMQGAANQQNAAGQAATMQAQQQIAYQQALAAQQAQMVGQGQGALNASSNAANQIYGTGAGLQGNINQANAGLASSKMGQQTAGIGGIGQSIGGLSQLIGGSGAGGLASTAMPTAAGSSAAGTAATGTTFVDDIGPMAGEAATAAEGGKVDKLPRMASGGPMVVSDRVIYDPANISSGFNQNPGSGYKGQSSFGNFLSGSGGGLMSGAGSVLGLENPQFGMSGIVGHGIAGGGEKLLGMADGGKVPALVSPGERYLKPKDVEKVKAGANPMEIGEKIPGKPKVGGAKNDYANDTVPKTLDEGGIVIPRSVVMGPNPHWESMKFVRAHMAKGGMIPNKPKKAKK